MFLDCTGEKMSDPKTYVITSAQASYQEKQRRSGEIDHVRRGTVAALNQPLMKSLEAYCSAHNAELIILTMNGKDASEKIFHESVAERPELYHGNRGLNSNIAVSDMVVPPQNVDPSTGRLRFAQRDTTLVYAHPKQRLRPVPASNSKLPRLLITTGAVTHPNYNPENHRGDVAFRDHAYGAVVVEVIDDVNYNVRHLGARKNGSIIDLGERFSGGKLSNAVTEALVLGDLHIGDTDPKTMVANYEMIDYFHPKRLMIHDLMSGNSINPHEKDNLMTRARKWEKGQLSLEGELRACNTELQKLANAVGRRRSVNIISSNHDFFLNRYLESGDFVKEPWNTGLAIKLAAVACDGGDPVEAGVRMMGNLPSNVHFLNLADDMKVWGWQLASHGHKGNSGARTASPLSRELAHGKSITGHTHSPSVLRDTIIVGTSTHLGLPYTEGSAGAWMAANAVLYEGGLAQLIPIINGKWKGDR
jgi:hypothetical protein